mgnify:CR=1 FL=1
MFGRTCAIATFLPALLAAQDGTSFHPYVRADIGFARYLEIDVDSDDLEEFESVADDLESAMEFSLAGGLTGPQKTIGFGLVFQRDASEGESSANSSSGQEDESISNISATVTSTLVGAQVLFLHELSPKILLRGEIGLAKATTEQTLDIEGVVNTGTSYIPLTLETTVEGEGVAFLTSAGLDVRLTPNVSVGAMLNLVSGKSTPKSGEVTMSAMGESQTEDLSDEDMDEIGDQDISSFGLTGGVRVLF